MAAETLAMRDGFVWIFSKRSRSPPWDDCRLNTLTVHPRHLYECIASIGGMLCQDRIEARLSDAENLVRSGADIGDPHTFLRGLWTQVYDGAPMHLRSPVLRRLHALARRLGVSYEHGGAAPPA